VFWFDRLWWPVGWLIRGQKPELFAFLRRSPHVYYKAGLIDVACCGETNGLSVVIRFPIQPTYCQIPMKTFGFSTTAAWVGAALLAALLALAAYTAVEVGRAADYIAAMQSRAIAQERAATDFAALLHSYAQRASAIASTEDPEVARVSASRSAADVDVSVALQTHLASSPLSTNSKLALQRLIESRAELAAARNDVVQLRLAGETERANTEFSGRLEPSGVTLMELAEQLKGLQRKDSDALASSAQDAMQSVVKTSGIVALGWLALTVLTYFILVLGSSKRADAQRSSPLVNSTAHQAPVPSMGLASLADGFAKRASP
jgi:hypothetical protein